MVADTSSCRPSKVAEYVHSEKNLPQISINSGVVSSGQENSVLEIAVSEDCPSELKFDEILKECDGEKVELFCKECKLHCSSFCDCRAQETRIRKQNNARPVHIEAGNNCPVPSCFSLPEHCFLASNVVKVDVKDIKGISKSEEVQWARRPSFKSPADSVGGQRDKNGIAHRKINDGESSGDRLTKSTMASSLLSSASMLTSKCVSLPLLPSISDTDSEDNDDLQLPLVRSASLPIGVQKDKVLESKAQNRGNQLLYASESGCSSCGTSPGSPHPFLSRSSSCPAGRPSALRGGKLRPTDLHVRWAPEVWDPPPSSASHTVGSLASLQRSNRKSRHQSSSGHHGKRKGGDPSKGRRSNKGAANVSRSSNGKGGGGTTNSVAASKQQPVGVLIGNGEAGGERDKRENQGLPGANLKSVGSTGCTKTSVNSGLGSSEGSEKSSSFLKEGGSFSEDSTVEGGEEDDEWTVVSKKGGRNAGRSNIKSSQDHVQGTQVFIFQSGEAMPAPLDHRNQQEVPGSATDGFLKDNLILRSGDCLLKVARQQECGERSLGMYASERRCAVA